MTQFDTPIRTVWIALYAIHTVPERPARGPRNKSFEYQREAPGYFTELRLVICRDLLGRDRATCSSEV